MVTHRLIRVKSKSPTAEYSLQVEKAVGRRRDRAAWHIDGTHGAPRAARRRERDRREPAEALTHGRKSLFRLTQLAQGDWNGIRAFRSATLLPRYIYCTTWHHLPQFYTEFTSWPRD